MKITVKVGDMTLTIETEDQPVEIVGLNEQQPEEDKAQTKLTDHPFMMGSYDNDGYAPKKIRRIGSGRTAEGKRNHCGRCGSHQRRRSPVDGMCPDCRHLTDDEAEHFLTNDECQWCKGDE